MAETKKTVRKAPSKKAAPKKTSTSKTSMEMSSSDRLRINPFKLDNMSPRTRYTIVGILAVVLLGIVLYINRGLFVAALVNGQPISRLTIIDEIENQYGAGVLNRLIDRNLIIQEASKQNINVTQEEIDKRRKEIVSQVSAGNEDNFNEVLKAQGLTPEEFIEELRIQLLAEKMLGDKVAVSDEEFNKFVSENPDLLEDPENEEAKSQLREQLKQQKLQTEYTTWMESLRKEADVQRFVDY